MIEAAITITIIIALAGLGMFVYQIGLSIDRRVKVQQLCDRVNNVGDTLTYGMSKEHYEYKNAQDLRAVYQTSSINQEIWGDKITVSESAFGSG